MKQILTASILLAAALITGCATQSQVAQMESRGKAQVFAAPYQQVWRAAIDAAQIGDLEVRTADTTRGYIAAKRNIRLHTMGENVGIWVKQVSPGETQVEVVSRQAGPPKFWFKNWEDEILNAVAVNLTREAAAPIYEPSGAETRPVFRQVPPPPPLPPFPENRR